MTLFQSLSRLSAALLVAVGLFVLVGCDSGGGNMAPAQGDFALKLTDAPANVDSAVVTVDRVTLVGDDEDDSDDDDGEDDSDDNGDDDGDDGGPIVLTDSTRQIDLLRLQDGVTETLADVTVPEGTYGQLRFVLGSENYIVLDDGTRQTLQVPSGQQSGIKIVLPEVEIENDGDRIEITLDFDVDESLIEQGNGQYRFKPTIKVKNVFVNGQSIETVEVEGAVSAASSSEVSVDSIPFTVTSETEFDGDDGASGPGELQSGQIVEVDATILNDGTLEAREIEVSDDDEAERSITAPVQSVSTTDSTLTQLDVTMLVTDSTEFDDDAGFGAIESGDRVETDYVFDGADRVAMEIENEDDD